MTEQQNPADATNAGTPQSFVDRYQIHPFLFVAVCLASVFFLYQIGGAIITFLIIKGPKITRENVAAVRWITLTGQLAFILLPSFLFARLLSPQLRDVFPMRVPEWREFAFIAVSLFSLQQLFEVYLYLQEQIPVPGPIKNILDPIKEILRETVKTLVQAGTVPELLFVILVVALVPAVVEEAMFRGLIQRSLERAMPPLRAAIVSGTIFGLFHLNPFEVIPLIGLGCFLGFLRVRSGSMIAPVFAHGVNNLIAVLAVYFHLDDDTVSGSSALGVSEVSAVFVKLIVFGLLFVVTFFAYLRTTELGRRPVAGSPGGG